MLPRFPACMSDPARATPRVFDKLPFPVLALRPPLPRVYLFFLLFLICVCYDPSRRSILTFVSESYPPFLAHHNLLPICYPPLLLYCYTPECLLAHRCQYIHISFVSTTATPGDRRRKEHRSF